MKPFPPRHLFWTALLAVVLLGPPAAVAEPSYWALLTDGSEVTGQQIDNWNAKNRPRLGGRDLFDPRNPLLLLRDTRLKPALGGPHVVFTNGDVLPGRVTGSAATPEDPFCLAVAPAPPLRDGRSHSGPIRIRTARVRRIVLAGEPRGWYRPGTLLLAGGSALATEAVRWTAKGLHALTANGVRTFALTELAEVHMPTADAARAVVRDCVAPCPKSDSLLLRLSWANGAVLTVRHAMMVLAREDARNPYFHVQPGWAVGSIMVALKDLCLISARRCDEVPLSLMPAETLRQKSFTGFVWNWRRNRNVRGELLESGTVSADLGVGTHSYSAVAFDLPAGAAQLRFLAGLDRAVGAGGCVQLKVHRDSLDSAPIWKSKLLRGGDKPIRVGGVNCRNARRLILVTEFAHKNRPRGADPADIRDEVNWIVPTVRIDPAALKRHVGRLTECFPALSGWSLSGPPPGSAGRDAVWNTRTRRWDVVLPIPAAGLSFARKVHVDDRCALLSASAATVERGASLAVSAGDQALKCTNGAARLAVAQYPRKAQWDLLGHKGKQVDLSVKLLPTPNQPAPRLRQLTLQFHPSVVLRAKRAVFTWDPTAIATYQKRGNVQLTDDGMVIRQGSFVAPPQAAKLIYETCKYTNELTIEAVVTPEAASQSGPARIISLSSDGQHRNFTLAQEGDKLRLRLRTTRTGVNGMNPEVDVCKLRAGRPQYITVTYKPGQLRGYLNGRPVLKKKSSTLSGDFSNWDPNQVLLFGDEHREHRYWRGTIAHVTMYARAMSESEVRRRVTTLKQRLQREQREQRERRRKQRNP